MQTVHIIIKGKVQGVFYRANAKKKADELGLKGWVKNTGKNGVECVVSGGLNEVALFIEWCKKGPQKAVVSSVTATPAEAQYFQQFSIVK